MFRFIKKNYHWIIAAMALLQLLIYGGAVNNFTGYHMVPVSEALDISRTAFSLANSLRATMGVVSSLVLIPVYCLLFFMAGRDRKKLEQKQGEIC